MGGVSGRIKSCIAGLAQGPNVKPEVLLIYSLERMLYLSEVLTYKNLVITFGSIFYTKHAYILKDKLRT